MYEKDYIMRLVQEFMRMVARLSGLREKGQFKQLDEEIREAYRSVLKTGPEVLSGFGEEDWARFIRERSPEEVEMAAILQMIEGEALSDRGEKEAASGYFLRAFSLLEFCDSQLKNFSFDRTERMSTLKNYLK
ncbi:MAG: hypothetical protein ACOYXB_04220 [Bacteroidota bacterium]